MKQNLFYQQGYSTQYSPNPSSKRFWNRFSFVHASTFRRKKILFAIGVAVFAFGVLISVSISLLPTDHDHILPSAAIPITVDTAQVNQLPTNEIPNEAPAPIVSQITTGPYGYHVGLFVNLKADLITTSIAFVVVSFSSLCGTGGGGILVPLYIALETFSTQNAIPLSKATIFGGAVGNVLFNSWQRHPTVDRPRIDLNIAASFEPICLAGTTLGVLANHTFPTWLIVTLLWTVLGATTVKTCFKGVKKYKEENAPKVDGRKNVKRKEDIYRELCERPDQTAKEIYDKERHLAVFPILILIFSWVTILFFAALRGGAGAPSIVGIQCNSAAYWGSFFIIIPIMVGVTFFVGRNLMKKYQNKKDADYPFQQGDVVWDKAHAMYLPFGNYIAGVCAGMLGIGGGMIKGPIMMAIEVEPRTAAATTAFMILFTSSCTCAQFILFGQLIPSYAAWFAFVGFVASVLGQFISVKIISRFNRTYFIIFVLAVVVGGSCIFLSVEGIAVILQEVKSGQGLGFFPICPIVA